MEESIVHKFIDKFKNKFSKNKQVNTSTYEYAFSDEEIESINKENKQKIQELKHDVFTKKRSSYDSNKTDEVLSKVNNSNYIVQDIDDENLPRDNDDEILGNLLIEDNCEELSDIVSNDDESNKEESLQISFINLSDEHQKLVMDKWNEIVISKIDKDIMDAKDLLNHNYTITYADEASKFIRYIRKEYEIVICYLIGFNNEKQGIYNKTYFADNMEDEWKYLSNYIKMLEKIRKNK